jgi:hypothetical protein
MAIKHLIVLFVETPRKFITAVINLRGISTNKTIIKLTLQYHKAYSGGIIQYIVNCRKIVKNVGS